MRIDTAKDRPIWKKTHSMCSFLLVYLNQSRINRIYHILVQRRIHIFHTPNHTRLANTFFDNRYPRILSTKGEGLLCCTPGTRNIATAAGEQRRRNMFETL